MSSKSGLTIDVKSAIGDFRKYDEVTQKRFRAVLSETAFDVKDKQWTILQSKVKNWTGTLGGSLSPNRKDGGFTWEIGPDTKKVKYAEYVESGYKRHKVERKNMKTIGPYGFQRLSYNKGFAGYWYVRDSLKGMKRILTKRLKLAIERPV